MRAFRHGRRICCDARPRNGDNKEFQSSWRWHQPPCVTLPVDSSGRYCATIFFLILSCFTLHFRSWVVFRLIIVDIYKKRRKSRDEFPLPRSLSSSFTPWLVSTRLFASTKTVRQGFYFDVQSFNRELLRQACAVRWTVFETTEKDYYADPHKTP